jgi:RimJ/RimL family protein N-acetyltransferase
MFDWANDADVRAASFQTRPIGWDEHVAWLRDKLADARARIWLGEVGGKPAGIVRFQLRGKRATISVSVGAEWRGTGIGTRLIGAGSWRLLAEGRVASIDAWVRPDNATSLRAFEACGYRRRTSRALPRGMPADAVLMTLVATNRG